MFYKNFNKAAMFGLDARIALVVIASLSGISGAVLINSLAGINIDKILAEASTIGISVNNYHKDMNKSIFDTLDSALTADELELAAFTVLYKNENLITPYTTKWNGPYIRSQYFNNVEPYLNTPFRLVRKSADNSTTCNDVKTNPCYVFLKFKNLTNDVCDDFEDFTSGKNYAKVYKESSSSCNILINIALDY
jgi:hypothetical protein